MTTPTSELDTLIRKGTRLEGKLATSNTVIVEGSVDGDISAHAVIVKEGAHVRGSIDANSVSVSGAVDGKILCIKLQLTTTGKARGDFTQTILEVASGAVFEGSVAYRKSTIVELDTTSSESAKAAITGSAVTPEKNVS